MSPTGELQLYFHLQGCWLRKVRGWSRMGEEAAQPAVAADRAPRVQIGGQTRIQFVI